MGPPAHDTPFASRRRRARRRGGFDPCAAARPEHRKRTVAGRRADGYPGPIAVADAHARPGLRQHEVAGNRSGRIGRPRRGRRRLGDRPETLLRRRRRRRYLEIGKWRADLGSGFRQAHRRDRRADHRSDRQQTVWAGTGEANPRNDVTCRRRRVQDDRRRRHLDERRAEGYASTSRASSSTRAITITSSSERSATSSPTRRSAAST